MQTLTTVFGPPQRIATTWNPVIVVRHGIFSDDRPFQNLSYFLAAKFPNAKINNQKYEWKDSVVMNGARLADAILGDPSMDGRPLVLIGHSMGGLVCRVANLILSEPDVIQFRSDLFYRLNVFPVLLPALRERREDIPVLVTHFVELFSRRVGKQVDSIPPETMVAFQSYSWPGNIRELQNLVERAVILSRDGMLPNPLHKNQTELIIPSLHRIRTFCSSKALEDSHRALILETLDQAGWIVGGPRGAAGKLGLKRTTLLGKMRRLGISRLIPQEGTDVFGVARADAQM